MRALRGLGVVLAGLLVLGALGAGSASAAFRYQFEGQLAPAGGSFGFVGAGSVAVNDSNGDTYVADSGSGAVDVFATASGTQLAGLDGSLTPAGSFGGGEVAVAANDGTGAVFVLDSTDNVVDEFDAAGGYVCQITGSSTPSASECNGVAGSATPAGGFSTPHGITVDQATGEVYVVDASNGVVDVFSAGGAYLKQISLASVPGGFNAFFTRGVAVSDFNGDVYVSESSGSSAGVVHVFNAVGEYLTTWNGSAATNPPGTPAGSFGEGFFSVAVDNASGRVYVSENEHEVIDVLDASGEYRTQFSHSSFNELRGTAVDQATGRVYVSNNEGFSGSGMVDIFDDVVIPDVVVEPPSALTPTSATLSGVVNPAGLAVSDCHFDYGTTPAYGQIAPCVPAASSIPVDSNAHAVSADITGLRPDTTYYYRLQASNANGTNTGEGAKKSGELITSGPGIRSESVSNVASTSATLEASIDPHGAPTSFYFQYSAQDTGGCSEHPASCAEVPAAPGADLGSGEGVLEVHPQHVQGLLAATTYHYRVVAKSPLGIFDGEDLTFTTQAGGGGAVLPDGRAWEMVSPADKRGANLPVSTGAGDLVQAAAAGDAMTYLATAATEAEPRGFTNTMQVLSTRGPGGWESQDIDIPHIEATGLGITEGQEYRFFSDDLSLGVLQPFGGFVPSVSMEASEQTAYLRSDYLGGSVSDPCVESCYRPLVTGKAGYANVPSGIVFSTQGACSGGQVQCGPTFRGGTPDLRHIVLSSDVALTTVPIEAGLGALYEWSAGGLGLVSVLPPSEGGAAVAGSLGNPAIEARRTSAIAGDGSRVIWTTRNSRHLYMRYRAGAVKGETVRLDAVQGGSGEGEVRPRFQMASGDGSKVFFTDTQRLTAYSGGGAEESDLYECEMVEEAGELGCRLADLTPSNGGERADVQGPAIGASEDGSWLYFVADGVLAAGGIGGAPNLYVHHGGTTKLVAVLSANDNPDWGQGALSITKMSARVSPNGRWLAFMSQQRLTGYDNRDALSGQSDEEVYLYDAESGRVVCASCNPTGARPAGVVPSEVEERFVGGRAAWTTVAHPGLAAIIPGWTAPLYQSRYLSDSGRLFFDSYDALVPRDVNRAWDVYEYEPPGVGDCSTASAGFSARSAGCMGLISSGASPEDSAFLDASESGGDVFLLSTARLVPQDLDTALDIYDAHVCSVQSPCVAASVTPPVCSTADSCRLAPSGRPGVFAVPPSATFSGAGNAPPPASARRVASRTLTRAQKLARALRACRRSQGKRRLMCQRRARARYAARRSGKANATKRGRG